MKFLSGQRVPIHFHSATLRRNKDGERVASLRYKIKLNGNLVRSTPKFIQEAYRACKEAVDVATVRGEIEVQNIDFFTTPERVKANIRFSAAVFDHLVVQRSKESDIYLVMRMSVDIDDKLYGPWILNSYGTDLWAEFAEAQAKLIEEESEPEEEEESEEEEEVVNASE